MRLLRPIPPTPTQATFMVSLGGTKPRPRTCRGRMVKAAPVTAALVINSRRETSFVFSVKSIFLLGSLLFSLIHGSFGTPRTLSLCQGKFAKKKSAGLRNSCGGEVEESARGDNRGQKL